MTLMKKCRIVAVLAFLIAIASLGISYASLNTTKKIVGIATVQETKTSLKIDNYKKSQIDERINSVVGTPSMKANVLKFDCSLKTIGDYCALDFEIINDGSYAAKVTSLFIDLPGAENKPVSYEIKGINVEDVLRVEEVKNVSLVITYNDYSREEWEEIQEINIENIQFRVDYDKE